MRTPKILIILGAAVVISGCNSMPSVTDSMTEVKDSLTDSLTEVQETLALSSFPLFSEPEKLSEEEVRALFVGNTVDSHNRNTGLNSITYYHPNGRVIQQRLWSKRSGKWAVEDNGQICLAFGNHSMKCRHIVKEGDRYYKVRSDSDGEMQKIVRYRYFADGNLLKNDS